MRKQRAQAIGDILHEMLRQEGIETPLNEHRLIAAWPEVMGQGISRYTSDIYIRSRVLYVRILSSTVRMQLSLNRQVLAERLNRHIGAQVIERIVFL